jgi:hypothetical protein
MRGPHAIHPNAGTSRIENRKLALLNFFFIPLTESEIKVIELDLSTGII